MYIYEYQRPTFDPSEGAGEGRSEGCIVGRTRPVTSLVGKGVCLLDVGLEEDGWRLEGWLLEGTELLGTLDLSSSAVGFVVGAALG
jgi:hypothetical protein